MNIKRKDLPGRGNSQHKNPKTEMCLGRLRFRWPEESEHQKEEQVESGLRAVVVSVFLHV